MDIIPYMASAGWYAEWLRGLYVGLADGDARARANDGCGLKGKDFTRCRIGGGGREILLSIPVEGGASRLKRVANIPTVRISEHGNWRHTHMGALNAAYGRAPYFHHIVPMLSAVYVSGESSLERFNEMMHVALVEMLFGDDDPQDIWRAFKGSRIALERGREMANEISAGISIIDPLMHYGRETLLYLSYLTNLQLS